MFTSGHMFNSIRHTPFVTSNGRGGLNYIIGGFQNQLGVETQIVAILCKKVSREVTANNNRRFVGYCNSLACNKDTSYTESSKTIGCDMGIDSGDSSYVLPVNLHLPPQEWRISFQIVPVNQDNRLEENVIYYYN